MGHVIAIRLSRGLLFGESLLGEAGKALQDGCFPDSSDKIVFTCQRAALQRRAKICDPWRKGVIVLLIRDVAVPWWLCQLGCRNWALI